MTRLLRPGILASVAAVGLFACGGGSPTSPSGGVTAVVRDGGAGPSGATITITAAGVSAKSVTVSVGQSVTFVNNDNKAHEIASNPHPVHGTCPSIESGLGTIGAGQTKTTHAFANAGTCGYHDHLDDGNASLQGAIVVQ